MSKIILVLLTLFFQIILPFILFFYLYKFLQEYKKRDSRDVKEYNESEYYKQTGIEYIECIRDKGKYGEYLISKQLERLSGYKRFLFNLYVPKEQDETTEIDVILFHETGIYVFESKNYGGCISGYENDKNWIQVLPRGRNRRQRNWFFNPIMQNKAHIKWLKKYLEKNDLPVFSCVVFSDHCVLKDIQITSEGHNVIYRKDIIKTVTGTASTKQKHLSPTQIDELYNKLYPLTQISETEKAKHIQAIQDKQNSILIEIYHK